MSRAFIYAGTPQVIVSLWKVDDATTAWLMTRFYQHVQSGKSTATSLTLAQRDLLSRDINSVTDRSLKPIKMNNQVKVAIMDKDLEERRDPYLWAPFVLIGGN